MSSTYPTPPPKIETKVKAGAAWAYLAGVGALAIVNGVSDTTLVTDLPDTIEVFVAPLVPALAGGIAGWLARHTSRPDLPQSQR